ncbi:hypothetical protein SAMD00019534_103210, partial [Acytostelium subglobosum LB1]|uniref:hypothetical protein n=1 Tax=Acytostelium subglobosum LB1 TaxID=1410327 RepID=UPI0006452081
IYVDPILTSNHIPRKSALSNQFVKDIFIEEYDPTTEDCYSKKCVVNGHSYNLNITDPSGENYYCLSKSYMLRGEAFVIMYSITERYTFELIPSIVDSMRRIRGTDKTPIVLVGNKIDLESQRKVDYREGEELARRLKCPFLETSSKHKVNVDNVFYKLIGEMVSLQAKEVPTTSSTKRSSSSISPLKGLFTLSPNFKSKFKRAVST